jgi:hypothetical protein
MLNMYVGVINSAQLVVKIRTYNLLICAQNYSYALKNLLSRSEY